MTRAAEAAGVKMLVGGTGKATIPGEI